MPTDGVDGLDGPGERPAGSEPASLRDRANAGVVWSALQVWGTHAFQLAVVLVLARLLEPRDFGLFALAQVALVLVQALANQGLPEALVQADRGEDRRLWSTGMLAVAAGCAAGAGALFLAAPVVAAGVGTPDLEPLVASLAPAVLLHGVHAVCYARLRDRLMFASAARAGIAGAAAAFLAGVPAALAGLGVWALVISAYATQVVETLLLVRAAGVPPLAGFDQATYRRLARFGRYIVAGSLTTFLDRRTDDYFVGLFLGPAVLGLYSVAYRVLELVTTVSLRAVERVAFPVLAKLQDAPELVADAVRTSFRFVSFAAFPAFAGLAVVAPELVQVALGDDWNGAAQPLRILALGGFGLATTTVLPSVLRALGRPGLAVAIAAVKGVTIAAAFAVTARWSVEAVAWTFVVGAFLTAPVFLVSVCRLVPLSVRDYVAAGAGALGASLVMVGVLLGAAPVLEPLGPLLRLCASVLIGGLAYVGAASVLAPGRLSELRQRLRSLRAGDARRRLG